MIKILFGTFALLLIAGPLRKPLLAQWRVAVPLAAGAIIGFIVVAKLMPGAPGWMLFVGPVFGAFTFGPAVVELFHMMKK